MEPLLPAPVEGGHPRGIHGERWRMRSCMWGTGCAWRQLRSRSATVGLSKAGFPRNWPVTGRPHTVRLNGALGRPCRGVAAVAGTARSG